MKGHIIDSVHVALDLKLPSWVYKKVEALQFFSCFQNIFIVS